MTCIEGFWVKLASCEQIESKLVSWKCGREPIILTSPLIQNTEWVENLNARSMQGHRQLLAKCENPILKVCTLNF